VDDEALAQAAWARQAEVEVAAEVEARGGG
jgi:hypothetical protein